MSKTVHQEEGVYRFRAMGSPPALQTGGDSPTVRGLETRPPNQSCQRAEPLLQDIRQLGERLERLQASLDLWGQTPAAAMASGQPESGSRAHGAMMLLGVFLFAVGVAAGALYQDRRAQEVLSVQQWTHPAPADRLATPKPTHPEVFSEPASLGPVSRDAIVLDQPADHTGVVEGVDEGGSLEPSPSPGANTGLPEARMQGVEGSKSGASGALEPPTRPEPLDPSTWVAAMAGEPSSFGRLRTPPERGKAESWFDSARRDPEPAQRVEGSKDESSGAPDLPGGLHGSRAQPKDSTGEDPFRPAPGHARAASIRPFPAASQSIGKAVEVSDPSFSPQPSLEEPEAQASISKTQEPLSPARATSSEWLAKKRSFAPEQPRAEQAPPSVEWQGRMVESINGFLKL